ncbi:MAG: aspartyl protease family protein [Rhizomicrobium sp.]
MRNLHKAALALVLFATPALADDCKPLTLITTIDLKTDKEHDAVFAPVTLDGKNELLQVDTGGAFSELTRETADDLKLDREPVNVGVIDVNGQISYEAGRVKSAMLGNLHVSDMDFIIAHYNPFGDGNTEIAGILGPDILMNYDTEFDFGTDKMTLLSPDHCPGKVIYWPADAVAMVPIKVAAHGHITFPVTLDGKQITAMLDTGASETTVRTLTAESVFGLTPTSPGMSAVGSLSDKTHGAAVQHHKFKTLSFGDPNGANITVGNPEADIVPDEMSGDPRNENRTGTRLASKHEEVGLPDMLLGMNILKHLHIYIAYGEQRLYITPASAPAKP